MASIKSQMTLNDGMSAVLKKINNALNTTLSSFEQVQRASGNAIDVAKIEQARMELVEANREIDSMAEAFRKASEQQDNLNQGLQNGTGFAGNLLGKITAMAGAYIGIGKVKSFVQTAMADATEGINVSAQLTKSLSNMGLGGEAYKAISDAANQYRYYGQTAFQAAGAEFATYLGNDKAIISMMDTLSNYAVGMSGGGELDTSQIVDYATQLGKVLVGSYDGITKKGFELTEVQKKIIETGTDMEKAAVIADVINESWGGLYETMANTPAGKIQQLNVTLGEMVENVGYGLYPAMVRIADTVQQNLPQIEGAMLGIAAAIGFVLNILTHVIQGTISFGTAVADNWGIIGPIIGGVAAALLIYNGYLLANNVLKAINNFQLGLQAVQAYKAAAASTVLSAAERAEAMSAAAATAAQHGLNAAMLASPVTWIIIAIIALIAIFYAAVAAVNKFAGTSYSATGLIAGAFMWLMALIGNIVIGTLNAIIQYVWTLFVEPFLGIIEWILNACNGGFNSFGDAVANLIGQIISWFLSLGKVVTKIIDAIFGTNWTAGLSSLQDSVLAWGKNETAITLDRNAPTIDHRFDMTDAFDMGNDFGKGIEDKIGGLFNYDLGNAEDFAIDNIGDNVSDIADSSAATAGALSVSNEQLEYLRDIAEREAINRFTTAEVKIDMTGMTNRIDGSNDLDGIITQLTDGFTDALLTAAEGVHA